MRMVALRTFVATVEHARLIPLARVRLGLPEIFVKKVDRNTSPLKMRTAKSVVREHRTYCNLLIIDTYTKVLYRP